MQIEKIQTWYYACDGISQKSKTHYHHDNQTFKNYTLKYLYNTNEIFFHLFMHTKVYDKTTNENIENQGILLRSWNPITKKGEQYIFKKGEGEGNGDFSTKVIHFSNTKTIFDFSSSSEIENIKEKRYYKLAEEIIAICPHKDIELKFSNS
jgi:hypothetical protein